MLMGAKVKEIGGLEWPEVNVCGTKSERIWDDR